MIEFAPILDAATARNGPDALANRLPEVKDSDALRAVPDDRYLSLIALRVFRAGLKHSLVDAKWPAFEEVFHGFDPAQVHAMPDDALEALMADRRVIRNWPKIKSVRANAQAIRQLAETHGGFGAYIADWPGQRVVDLWTDLTKRFSQLGGNSGPYLLRMAGKDTFILTDPVVRALNHWGAFDGTPKGKSDRAAVQDVFNGWATETGRPLAHLSMILAQSVD